MTVDYGNPDVVDSAMRDRVSATLHRLLDAPDLFPIQRILRPTPEFFDASEVTLVFGDDDEIKKLNQAWRGKETATDVLSWPAVNVDEPLEPFLGDIAISLDTAGRQAASRSWSLLDEICLLAVHGFLHLIGHDDDEDEDAARMRVLERFAVGKPLTLDGDANAEA